METPKVREEKQEERKGFTLVELMVVISIIGILAGIAFVSMMHYRTVIRVNASARDLSGQLRLARAKAVKDGVSIMVNFTVNPSSPNYQIGRDGAEDGAFDGFFHTYYLQPGIKFGYPSGGLLISAVPGHTYPVTRAVDINNGATTRFHFRQDGTASLNGVAYLIPMIDTSSTGSRDDRCRAVDWELQTGRIRTWKWKYDRANPAANTWR